MDIALTPSKIKVPSEEEREAHGKFNASRNGGDPSAEWKLYYWPFLIGRGEFIRLMFEEAGVAYEDVGRTKGVAEVAKMRNNGDTPGRPTFAPPVIQNGDFKLSETAAIMQYLGKKFGLCPETEEQQAEATSILLTTHDFIGQARLAFHLPPDTTKSYYAQVEEARPAVEFFKTQRLPKMMEFLERTLKYNNGGTSFFVGDKVTYADISAFHLLQATESQFPEAFESYGIPTLKAFMARMAARPRLAAYLASDRRGKFEGNSMM